MWLSQREQVRQGKRARALVKEHEREDAIAKLGLRLLLKATPLFYEGLRVGHLTLREYVPGVHPAWVAVCDCGTVTTVRVDNMKAGRTIACGCLAGSVGHHEC